MPVLFTSFFQKEIFWCLQKRFLFVCLQLQDFFFFFFSKLTFKWKHCTLLCPSLVSVGGDQGCLLFSLFHLLFIAQLVKNPPGMQETPVQFLGQEDLLEKE